MLILEPTFQVPRPLAGSLVWELPLLHQLLLVQAVPRSVQRLGQVLRVLEALHLGVRVLQVLPVPPRLGLDLVAPAPLQVLPVPLRLGLDLVAPAPLQVLPVPPRLGLDLVARAPLQVLPVPPRLGLDLVAPAPLQVLPAPPRLGLDLVAQAPLRVLPVLPLGLGPPPVQLRRHQQAWVLDWDLRHPQVCRNP